MFSSLVCVDFSDFITLCISGSGTVYSFGNSSHGSHGFEQFLVFPPKEIKDLVNIKLISCSASHTICVDIDGNCFSFGSNNYGKLGIGKDNNELKQTYIPQKIIIPPIKYVSCGNEFVICLSEHDLLYSFGNNDEGQLGIGKNKAICTSPELIPNFKDIELINCGKSHVICKTLHNTYFSWGDNRNGQLGQGNHSNCSKPTECLNWPNNIISIKSKRLHTLLLTENGEVYAFGKNNYGQLGLQEKEYTLPTLINDLPKIKRIECGNEHSMCIDIEQNLWLFGDNFYAQLGLGDRNIRRTPVIHPTLTNIIDISSGGFHTFVKTIDNKIYAFGLNRYSQLGIKTPKEEKQARPIQVFKDNEDIWCSFIGKSRAKSARK